MPSRLDPGTLYVVATPIGNLRDLSQRALEVLGSADTLFAEDTRTTRRLMTHHGLSVRLVSAHAHNEPQRARELVRRLEAGEAVAVVTDAGSPGLSDPGGRLVAAAAAAGRRVVAVPGPSALVAALSVCGLPTDAFSFAGFLPSRVGPRRRRLEELLGRGETLVFFEAPHRVRTTLKMLDALAPEARVAACREMTKKFEEVLRGRPGEVLEQLTAERERGEWTLVLSPGDATARETPPPASRGTRAKGEKRGSAGARARVRGNPVDAWIEEQVRQGTAPEEARQRAHFLYGGAKPRSKPGRRA